MLTVLTVLKSGGVYDATWVARLKAGVERHLPERHQFICFSDVPVPCSHVYLEHNWPAWWSKIEALRYPGPALYLDLDTLPVGDMTDIAVVAQANKFVMLRDFYSPHRCASGVMAWRGSAPAQIYQTFARDPERSMLTPRDGIGDQAFIESLQGRDNITRWQDVLPAGQIVSYKADDCRRRGIPDNARLICLHGVPKFTDMSVNDPVRRAWEMAA